MPWSANAQLNVLDIDNDHRPCPRRTCLLFSLRVPAPPLPHHWYSSIFALLRRCFAATVRYLPSLPRASSLPTGHNIDAAAAAVCTRYHSVATAGYRTAPTRLPSRTTVARLSSARRRRYTQHNQSTVNVAFARAICSPVIGRRPVFQPCAPKSRQKLYTLFRINSVFPPTVNL